MKKIITAITCITMTMLSFSQIGNEGTPETTESYGAGAGINGEQSNYFGVAAGGQDDGTENNFFGFRAGLYNKGKYNVFIGNNAAIDNLGNNSVFVGHYAGFKNKDGYENTYIGHYSGVKNISGYQNTYLGANTGELNEGFGNVFIGYSAGKHEMYSNKLYIENSASSDPLIYGDFLKDRLTVNGKMGIGTTDFNQNEGNSDFLVDGKILCEEVEVIQDVLPDYVFQKYYTGASTIKADYVMPTLEEVEEFTKENHHLPEVPSAAEVKEQGLELKEMTTILLQKIEELTLYTIEQEKRIKALEDKLSKK